MADHPEVPSAFIAGPPLTPGRAEDRTLFKGRTDLIELIEHDLAPDRRGVLLVVGQRRMGKTSLCNYLPTHLGTGTLVVVSNFQPLSGDAHRETPHRRVLGDLAARSIGTPAPLESPAGAKASAGSRTSIGPAPIGRSWSSSTRSSGSRMGSGPAGAPPTSSTFSAPRATPFNTSGFCSSRRIHFHRLGPHWTDRLVSVTSRTISYLDEDDARDLLCHPIPEFPDIYPAGGIELILAQTGRHPYLLQKAGDDLCRLLNSRGGLRTATLDELTEVFDGMVRDVQVFDEIWRSRTEDEHATLRRLAQSDEPGDLDPAAIALAREGYLERRGDKAAIVVPLFREWIRMNVI